MIGDKHTSGGVANFPRDLFRGVSRFATRLYERIRIMARRSRCASLIARRNGGDAIDSPVANVIDVLNHSQAKVLTTYKLKKLSHQVLDTVLGERDIRDAEISVLYVDDAEMASLNLRHRGRKKPTDVLAFPMRGAPGPAMGPNLLGDIVISVETARRQAEEADHPVEREIAFLLIHGLLHLLGFDHNEDDLGDEMRACEAAYREIVCEEAPLVS